MSDGSEFRAFVEDQSIGYSCASFEDGERSANNYGEAHQAFARWARRHQSSRKGPMWESLPEEVREAIIAEDHLSTLTHGQYMRHVETQEKHAALEKLMGESL